MNIQENISLVSYNTFHINVSARQFASFKNADELQELLVSNSTPLILGGGSNILFTKDFDGLVLKNDIPGIETVHEDADHVYVKVGAGENWHTFVMHCIDSNFAGVENLSLIPGNVGASPMQNIGAYGVEIKEVFHDLEAMHLKERTVHTFSLNDCAFGYRDSIF